MFVHVVLTEDLREDWTCPTEPPLKIKSLLLLLLLLTDSSLYKSAIFSCSRCCNSHVLCVVFGSCA